MYKAGIFEKYGVKVLGTPISSVMATEDRQTFADGLKEIGEKLAPSTAVNTVNYCPYYFVPCLNEVEEGGI